MESIPPAISVRPLGKAFCDASCRAVVRLPVREEVAVRKSYNSADAVTLLAALVVCPAEIRILPLSRSVVRLPSRAVVIFPAGEKLPLTGSYSSAEPIGFPAVSLPPMTRTLPVGRRITLGLVRAVAKLPVDEKVPVAGL